MLAVAKPEIESAVASALAALKPYAIGVLCGVLTSAVAQGAQDNAGFVDSVRSHWVVWAASALVTLITGGAARGVQKYAYVRGVQTGTATPYSNVIVPSPSNNQPQSEGGKNP